MRQRELVPVGDLVDLERLREGGREPTPSRIRAALPRGWALAEDGRHAYRDARLLFREGWILVVGLVVFGSVGLAFLWGGVPGGWSGALRIGVSVVAVLLVGGLVAPRITRALFRR